MNSHIQRYFFIEYDNLQQIKFRKLEKVCDKIFVLIKDEIESVPFKLVKQIQNLGKNARWIGVSNKSSFAVGHSMAFLMGQIHEREDKEIEFAILSNKEEYDNLVDFINFEGRSCIRVKTKKKKEGKDSINMSHFQNDVSKKKDIFEPQMEHGNSEVDHKMISKTAKNTIKRLIDSGNRPSELSLLKNYILTNNSGKGVADYIELIIDYLEELNEIEINKEEVIYNF